MSAATHAYVGRKACGCIVAATADDQGTEQQRQRTAAHVSEFIASGLTVERVEMQVVKEQFTRCPHGQIGLGL